MWTEEDAEDGRPGGDKMLLLKIKLVRAYQSDKE